jgi:uncharacterized protein
MKYLIVILVVALAGWMLFRARAKPPRRPGGAAASGQPQAMVQCRHCGVHLPRNDALEDKNGLFCSEAHRLAGPR